MAGYVFALGRGGETTLAADAPAGATSLTVTTTGALATGDWVFASWADGWMQWLGRVKLAGAQSLTLTRPLARPLAAGASVWRPEDVIVTPAAAATPLVIEIESGVVHERSAGGEWTAVQCSRPLVTTQLRLEGLTPAVEAMLVEWLARRLGAAAVYAAASRCNASRRAAARRRGASAAEGTAPRRPMPPDAAARDR